MISSYFVFQIKIWLGFAYLDRNDLKINVNVKIMTGTSGEWYKKKFFFYRSFAIEKSNALTKSETISSHAEWKREIRAERLIYRGSAHLKYYWK